MTVPVSYNRPLLLAAVELSKRVDPVSGQFKLAFKVRVNGRTYAAKRTATSAEVDEFHWNNSGAFSSYDRKKNQDLLREVWAQETGHIQPRFLNAYVAWGFIGETFWAVQPWLNRKPSWADLDGCNLPSSDLAPANARRAAFGRILLIDWGYDVRSAVYTDSGFIKGDEEK